MTMQLGVIRDEEPSAPPSFGGDGEAQAARTEEHSHDLRALLVRVSAVSAPVAVALVVGALFFVLALLQLQAGRRAANSGSRSDRDASAPPSLQQRNRIRAFIETQIAAYDVVLIAATSQSPSFLHFQTLFDAILSPQPSLSVVDLEKTAQGKRVLEELQEHLYAHEQVRNDFFFVRGALIGDYNQVKSLLLAGKLEKVLRNGKIHCTSENIRVDADSEAGFIVLGPQNCFQSIQGGETATNKGSTPEYFLLETRPLDTAEELLNVDPAVSAAPLLPQIPLAKRGRNPTRRSKLLVCHDMKGGYLSDRFTQGSPDFEAYRFYQWDLVDLFVYFGHHLVCIPPVGWVAAGHRNGTRVLGAFVTEGEVGATISKQIFRDKATAETYASKLAAIATHRGFDGWLVNVENSVPEDLLPNVFAFLHVLQRELKASNPDAQVIWYASLARDGRRKHQVRLDVDGVPFFRYVDGFYTDYGWTSEDAKFSAAFDLDRRFEIYMGVDVFGRHDMLGGGKMNCDQALCIAWNAGVSAALFAPGWTHECLQHETSEDFVAVEDRFWRMIRSSWKPKSPCFDALGGPDSLYSSFNVGRGKNVWVDGQRMTDAEWSNLLEMDLQPVAGLHSGVSVQIRNSELTATLAHEVAFQGGTCVSVQGQMSGKDKAYFKLFDVDIELSARRIMEISYTTRANDGSVVLLVLTVCPGMDRPAHQIILRSDSSGNDSDLAAFTSAVAGTSPGKHFYSPVWTRSFPASNATDNEHVWVKKTYRLGGMVWDQKHIVEIGVLCTTKNSSKAAGEGREYQAYIGEVCLAGHANVRSKSSIGTIAAEPKACVSARVRSFQRTDSEHVSFGVEWEFSDHGGESVAYVLVYLQDAGTRVLLGKSFGSFYHIESCPWPTQEAAASTLLRIELVSVSWTGARASNAAGGCNLYLQE